MIIQGRLRAQSNYYGEATVGSPNKKRLNPVEILENVQQQTLLGN
jgi:hypothetical protein